MNPKAMIMIKRYTSNEMRKTSKLFRNHKKICDLEGREELPGGERAFDMEREFWIWLSFCLC